MLAHAQGLITMTTTASEVYTNNGASSGPATGPAGTYLYEMLDMTRGAWNALSAGQQAAGDNVFVNPVALSLWTDSGISGMNTAVLHPGGITGLGGVAGTTAANWTAPTGSTYNTGGIDYYTIVGWSANAAGSWTTLTNDIISATLPGGLAYFYGQTQVAYNYAGGGLDGLPTVSVFADSSYTGLAGSGGLPATDALTLYSLPEPATLALVSLGTVSILFLRRRKANL